MINFVTKDYWIFKATYKTRYSISPFRSWYWIWWYW